MSHRLMIGRWTLREGLARATGIRAAAIARLLIGLGLALTYPCLAHAERLAPLPVPYSNNAVAKANVNGNLRFYSFMGLKADKSYSDISKEAFEFDVRTGKWRRLPDVPVARGRLASTAVAAGRLIYLFGGYTVAADGTETSTPDVLAFDPRTRRYSARAPIPVPVDDSVAVAFKDRYIYLISGWHDKGNVALVQVYDAARNRWFRATDWPGSPVFGHSGGIVGNQIVVTDGVAVIPGEAGKRRFKLTGEAWIGDISSAHPSEISWRRLPPHPGGPLYRAAAAGAPARREILFAGGSETAYNYDGQGYDGSPADPSDHLFAFDLRLKRWVDLGAKPVRSMDHRGLLEAKGVFFTLGGMGEGRRVIDDAISFKLPKVQADRHGRP